jgi:hypothetical protein
MGIRKNPSLNPDPDAIERDAKKARSDIQAGIDELRRRGSRLVSPRQNPLAYVGAGLAGIGVISLFVWRARHQRLPEVHAKRLRDAVSRMRAHPERVAKPAPSMARNVGTAALSALAASAVRRYVARGA